MNEKLHTKYGDISLTKRGKFWHLYIVFPSDIPYQNIPNIVKHSIVTPSEAFGDSEGGTEIFHGDLSV